MLILPRYAVFLAESAVKKAMDDQDHRILRELRRNGRITNQELSEKVNLSPSPCLRRVRAMEEAGLIAGYTAVIDQAKFGKPVTLFVRVKISNHCRDAVSEFENSVQQMDNVLSCYLISGDYDYMLHVIVESTDDYERFVRDRLHKLSCVSGIDSGFAYGCIKRTHGLFVSPNKSS